LISFQQEACPESVALELGMEPGKVVCRLNRLRLGNGEPIAYDSTWLPLFYGQLLEGYDFKNDTIYRILEEEHDIPVLRGRYRLDAVNAEAGLAAQLNVGVGRALFLVERVSMTTSDKPVYFQRRYYRPDRVKYELELARDTSGRKSGDRGMPLREFAPVFRNAS
jgi:GntR family transcriptional regulator